MGQPLRCNTFHINVIFHIPLYIAAKNSWKSIQVSINKNGHQNEFVIAAGC